MLFNKMRIIKTAAVVVMAICLLAMPARAKGPVLEVAAWTFPPFAYVDKDGKYQGQAVETVEKVLTAMGYTPKFVLMPFKRCLAIMRDGGMPMMLPCATSEERTQYMEYSDPVFHITTVLWKKGGDMSNCWQDFDDLAGLRVGVGLGYSYGQAWDVAAATGSFFQDPVGGKSPEKTHFQMLAEGRIDTFISDLSVGDFLKKKYSPRFDDIYPCPKKIGEDRPFGAPISLKYFADHELSRREFLRRFNAILEWVNSQ